MTLSQYLQYFFFIRCPYPALAITFPRWSLLPFCGDPNKTYDLSIMVQHQHIPRWQVFSMGIYFVLATLKTPQVRKEEKKINQITPCSWPLSLLCRRYKETQGFLIFSFCHPAGSQSRAVPFASCHWLMKVNLISSTSLQIPSNASIWCILSELAQRHKEKAALPTAGNRNEPLEVELFSHFSEAAPLWPCPDQSPED